MYALHRGTSFCVMSGTWHHQYYTTAYAQDFAARLDESDMDADMKMAAIQSSLMRHVLYKLAIVPMQKARCEALQSVILQAVRKALGVAKTFVGDILTG